jgi:hypothetical protein
MSSTRKPAESTRKPVESARNAQFGDTATSYTVTVDLTAFPGGDLVQEGLADLARGAETTIPALLVLIGAPRLRRLGLPVPETLIHLPEHHLYELLAETDPDSAHSRYNALVRRLVSFEHAAECAGL